MIFQRLTIGRKLFVTIIATVVATIMFFAIAVYWNTRFGISQYILTAEVARLEPVANALAEVYDPDAKGWPQIVENRRVLDRIVRFNLITSANPRPGFMIQEDVINNNPGPDGEPEIAPGPADAGPRFQDLGPPPEASSERPRGPRDRLNMRARLALVDAEKNYIAGGQLGSETKGYHPIVWLSEDGEGVTVGYLSIAMPNIDQRAADLVFNHNQIRMLTITGLLALILSVLAAFLLSRVLVEPINELLAGAKKLSDGKLDTRFEVTRYDEMGELQTQFNRLAQTLEDNERSERQWISNTSHELQTPLAVLRAEIEALEDGVRQADKKTLATLHGSVIRLSSLVKDISTLSHAREAAVAGTFHAEDFSALVEESATRAESLISEAELKLELEIEPELIVDCNRLRIGQLLDNLLSNSVRYTDKGGTVRLTVFRQRKRVVIECEDTTPCPPDASIPKLFDRFYRNEESRSRFSGGSGLGLPICKAIVVAHRGKIHAEKSPMGGLKIVAVLPINNFELQVK